ncbi:MAG TPA: RodZ domain-containing protein [Gallionella sp.]|nr:RodZ domain-containing protein [Gallionella sp.]
MEQQQNNDIPAAQATPGKPGHTLREARERLGLSVADVAHQIKFAPRQIEALEADDFQHLPQSTFLRGFIRSYAKLLQLDAQPLLAALPNVEPAPEQNIPASVEVPFPTMQAAHRQNLIWLSAALVVALIAAGFVLWHFNGSQTKQEIPLANQPAAATTVPQQGASPAASDEPVMRDTRNMAEEAAPAATQPTRTIEKSDASPAQKPVEQSVPVKTEKPVKPEVIKTPKPDSVATVTETAETVIRLVFDDESWTEVTDKSGAIISSQINLRGSELHLSGHAPFSLVIGHAASAHLYYQGKPVDLTPYINSSSEVARLTLE